jgi:hypothetical protein
VSALQSVAHSEDVLLLCDNTVVLCAIKKWVGQGGKATLATAPDADILREIGCLLMQRVRAGRATFLTLFLVPECAQPAFCFTREESHVSISLLMHIDFL